MLYSVTVTNPKGEALELELANPEKSGLAVANVEGLSPPKATINGQQIATVDGMMYSGARAESRNIVFTLVMQSRDANSSYGLLSIEDARHLTYRYFPLKKKINMAFRTDSGVYYIDGYVESNEVPIFSSEEYAQISVICPNPYFTTKGEARTIFSGVQPEFEFPFWSDTNEGDSGLIEFSSIWLNTAAILDYQGTVDTGIAMTIHAFGEVEGIHLFNLDSQERFDIDTEKIQKISGKPFGAKDEIVISTVKMDRYCQLLREGVYTNIIGAVDRRSDWFQISTGNNGFAFTADAGENNLSVTFSYRNAYVGV